MEINFQRYLRAKRSVDSRAFNHHVWDSLLSHLRKQDAVPLRVLEVGGGIGSLAQRLLAAELPQTIDYSLVDQQAENVSAAQAAVGAVTSVHADAFEFIQAHGAQAWDLLVAHAFLDLVDLPTALPRLLSGLRPGGAVYFPINYDGLTSFEPETHPEFEAALLAGYHRSMDQRTVDGRPSGDSRTGRHLFHQLEAAGVRVLAAGASDWVVHAQAGDYVEDEAYFLEFILATIENEMRGRPEIDDGKLDAWLDSRRAQVQSGELVYIAHQLDFFGVLGE